MTSRSSNSCIICDKPNALRCKRCKSASYCSTLCQRGDYPIHKLLCSGFPAFGLTKRPTKEHVRAVIFPVDQKRPKLVWLHCEWTDPEEDEEAWQCARGSPFLGDGIEDEQIIRYNQVLGRRLSDVVCISYRDTFGIDGSLPNDSIEVITATVPGRHMNWCGPIIAYGRVESSFDPNRCRDIDMNDFRHITDYLVSYYSDRTSSTPIVTPAARNTIKGVKINCVGDQKLFNKPRFEEFELPESHLIFTDHDTSDITERIGLPIFTQRCFPHPNWANVRDPEKFGNGSPYVNQDATFLHLFCDPNAEANLSRGVLGWGWAPLQWQNTVGSVIVVRQDKKPLSPWHVEALCRYCRRDARAYLAHSLGEYEPDEPMSQDLALSMICRPTFSIRWYKMCDEKHANGEVVDAPFPYNV